ncbi:MAG TPA: VWA domain-containing protein [Deltaproteobacteria bacterium]|nr:VWA domain-containing protein [Deltaproteobacteria bacterium]
MRNLISSLALVLLASCKSNLPSQPATDKRPGVETRVVDLCVDGDATEGVASFVLRYVDGTTIPASSTTIEQSIDGDTPGSGKWEGGQSLGSENLSSDLHVTLVLDASSSIVEDGLFDEMKSSAMALLEQGAAAWEGRPGTFSWQVIWFNQWVWEADSDWSLSDIETIPGPAEGDDGFTRMYAAMDFAVLEADRQRLGGGVASGPRDTHLLVVFTDGQDNSSGRDSPDVPAPTGATSSGAGYTTHATTVTTQRDVEQLLAANNDWLQVSMLGLGAGVDRTVLESFAQAGGGSVFEADNVGVLFEQAEKSFETLQTVGWRLPLNPGDTHDWRLSFSVDDLPKSTTVDLRVGRNNGTPECVSAE